LKSITETYEAPVNTRTNPLTSPALTFKACPSDTHCCSTSYVKLQDK